MGVFKASVLKISGSLHDGSHGAEERGLSGDRRPDPSDGSEPSDVTIFCRLHVGKKK